MLVTDGGTVVIGGVIQSNNSVSIAQVPLLGSIPWLGNLFKHQTVNSSNQELIFFITPRVIEHKFLKQVSSKQPPEPCTCRAGGLSFAGTSCCGPQ